MKPIYKIMFSVSVVLTILSLIALARYGLNLGVDFRGGTVLQVSFSQRPAPEQILSGLAKLKIDALKDASANPSGSSDIIIKSAPLTEAEHQQVLNSLKNAFPQSGLAEVQFDSIGPVVSGELKSKSVRAILMAVLGITVYVGFVFRKLSRTFPLWVMSAGTVAALAHDIILPLGVFAWLGHAYGVEISAVFVAAILTILGYAISDRVIILDRIRENLLKGSIKGEAFGHLVHRSVMQTLGRSINTAVTVLLSLVAIYLFGGESIRYFALALIVGVVSGAYSSIFVASPLLVWLGRRKNS